MSYHFKGCCVTCGQEIEFLSARPYERECVNCAYFTPKEKSPENPLSKNREFWAKFPAPPRGCVWYETDRRGKSIRRVDHARFDPLAKQYSAAVWRDSFLWKDSAGVVHQASRILSTSVDGLGEWRPW